uniref:phospholipase A and acyltransferase 4-like n=1 Tax=Gasterosteus aculeatus aculeatus TaxID=481459 RepID=UPI001A9930F6|nr:phospholipase A and acyltransferase 4-like [Gasterosteus aculeatus aculeatus]
MALTPYNHNAQPGDLIEIFRPGYQHWALYIGGNEVVHLTTSGSDSGSFGVMMTVLSTVGTVECHKIREVVGNDRFKINNLLDHRYKPRDRGVIVRDACELVGRELPYSAATFNCEHFVTGLRYGEPESRQVQTAATILGVGALVALGAVLFGGLLKDDEEDQREGRRGSRHRRRQQ